MNKICIIIYFIAITHLLSGCSDQKDLGGGYEIRYVGDDKELINKGKKFYIGPRIFFIEHVEKFIFVIKREPKIEVNSGTNNIIFGPCIIYLIDIENSREIELKSIEELKEYVQLQYFDRFNRVSIDVCNVS